MDNRREQIIDIIKREFIGPDPLPDRVQPNGEEILTGDPPRIRYLAGVLFPQEVTEVDLPPEEVGVESTEPDTEEPTIADHAAHASGKEDDVGEDLINLSNAFQQSAMSITTAVKDGDSVSICVQAGIYLSQRVKKSDSDKELMQWLRVPVQWNNNGIPLSLPERGTLSVQIIAGERQEHLCFHITIRHRSEGWAVYTFTLENTRRKSGDAVRDEECYFQAQFSLRSDRGFHPLPEGDRITRDDDYHSNQMLYHGILSYAMGHGCAAGWKEESGIANEIHTDIFPEYEIKPIIPTQIEGVSLDMFRMSDMGNLNATIDELRCLCEKYGEWIEGLRNRLPEMEDQDTAQRHIDACRSCLFRMEAGVQLLSSDNRVRTAFEYMNRVMLLQQLHYNMPLQRWVDDGCGGLTLEAPQTLPDILDKSTWPGNNPSRFGKWRPFQLAFILMNLKSMSDRYCDERQLVDLIWFPTGGGKTEAYLGLSAFSIFIHRLQGLPAGSTSILMRYTLRLLTAQQYERASALICACEFLRREKELELGPERISIGLWVGGSTTPNKRKEAVSLYDQLYSGKSEIDENPFVILKCPWCGAQMGVVEKQGSRGNRDVPGYVKKVKKGDRRIVLQCRNSEQYCDFSTDGAELPLLLVDEDIYETPPTLLIGTVDKFAMLPFRPEAQRVFGLNNGKRFAAPDLIIQDELHLISGPLGSTVGHYETLIHELCMDRRGGQMVPPKIIASTATISRAKEQCHALYACGPERVRQFPPTGLDAGDSFFAEEGKHLKGRKYVGILASASTSMATTMIRLYASLLYAAKAISVDDEVLRDPYWTNVGYFNSIRELGQMETWVKQDIVEYLHVIYKRRREDADPEYPQKRRHIYREKELTSRVPGHQIPFTLQHLGITYPHQGEERPVDICLATNMFSVGVDVPRLGMMCVAGQPKTTSEYIQATSRVGRSADSPGLVFTVFNPAKPRDKSHYEQFRTFHSRVYCHVEPTSVTPFSSPLRKRALHAIVIGLLRLFGNDPLNAPPRPPSDEDLQRVRELIAQRVLVVDADELRHTLRQIDDIVADWGIWEPEVWQDFRSGDALPLMISAGSRRNTLWGERGFETLMSMRSVDVTCAAKVLEAGYYEEV